MYSVVSFAVNYCTKNNPYLPNFNIFFWSGCHLIILPASAEVQLGKMFTPSFGTYVDGLLGIGGDRPYDWGVGVGSAL